MSDTLLTLRDVHINFPARKNWLGKTTEHVHAINGIDLQIVTSRFFLDYLALYFERLT